MRVIGLRSENCKKIKLVEVTPDANVVEVTGGNEQGKTSLLDGLESVFDGEKVLKRTPKPIREGEKRAFFAFKSVFTDCYLTTSDQETTAAKVVRNIAAAIPSTDGAIS